MKFSRLIIFLLLFLATAILAQPAFSKANLASNDQGKWVSVKSDPGPSTFNKPNLDAADGFDESEHERKIRRKPVKDQDSPEIRPINKHNL